MIGTAQRTTIGTVQRMTGMVLRKIGMAGMVGEMVVGIVMDLIAMATALEDVAGMVAAVEVQEGRGTVVLHMIAPELEAFTKILLQR